MKNNKGGEGYAANPDAKHYWYKDIFVYLTSFQDNKQLNADKYAEFNIKKKIPFLYQWIYTIRLYCHFKYKR